MYVYMYVYLVDVAVYHARAIIKFIVKSTGMMSPTRSGLVRITFRKPLPAPTMTPIGPLMLSVQPGIGSFAALVTIDGLTMTIGRSPFSSFNSCSAIAFV